jgi:hypothetical protein
MVTPLHYRVERDALRLVAAPPEEDQQLNSTNDPADSGHDSG